MPAPGCRVFPQGPAAGCASDGSALYSVQHDASPNALIGRTFSQLVDRAAISTMEQAPGPNLRTKPGAGEIAGEEREQGR